MLESFKSYDYQKFALHLFYETFLLKVLTASKMSNAKWEQVLGCNMDVIQNDNISIDAPNDVICEPHPYTHSCMHKIIKVLTSFKESNFCTISYVFKANVDVF